MATKVSDERNEPFEIYILPSEVGCHQRQIDIRETNNDKIRMARLRVLLCGYRTKVSKKDRMFALTFAFKDETNRNEKHILKFINKDHGIIYPLDVLILEKKYVTRVTVENP